MENLEFAAHNNHAGSEYVPEIVDFILRIIGNGYAYESNGRLFATEAFKNAGHVYRKLVPPAASSEVNAKKDLELLREGEGALSKANQKTE